MSDTEVKDYETYYANVVCGACRSVVTFCTDTNQGAANRLARSHRHDSVCERCGRRYVTRDTSVMHVASLACGDCDGVLVLQANDRAALLQMAAEHSVRHSCKKCGGNFSGPREEGVVEEAAPRSTTP